MAVGRWRLASRSGLGPVTAGITGRWQACIVVQLVAANDMIYYLCT